MEGYLLKIRSKTLGNLSYYISKGIAGTVIGGESCLWGETNSDSSHFLKLFSRTSAFADRLWNPEQKDKE